MLGTAEEIFVLDNAFALIEGRPALVYTKTGPACALRGCDAVVHLAAVADVNDVVADPARAELVNDRGTGVLLEAARAETIARVLYASTVWVYGDVPRR